MSHVPANQSSEKSEQTSNIIQVAVINKTRSLFFKKDVGSSADELHEQYLEVIKNETPIVTVKTDGTCGLVWNLDGLYYLMRRQDIKEKNQANFDAVMNSELRESNGVVYRYAEITRGFGKNEKKVPLYVLHLSDDMVPQKELGHLIGFTPISIEIPDDKHIMSVMIGSNGTPDLMLRSTVFEGSCDIPVRAIAASDILQGKQLMTVEIMGQKVANHYDFNSHIHFINPHGSIVLPQDQIPEFTREAVKQWFAQDETNRWADVEGLVLHFIESKKRFKFHRGHFGIGKEWMAKKTSGLKFIIEQ